MPNSIDIDIAAAKTGLEEQSLRRIAGRAARLGGWALDLNSNQLFWSDEVCAIHDLPSGYQPSLKEGLSFFPETVRTQVNQHLEDCKQHGTPYDFELPKLTARGREIWVRSIGEAVRDEGGNIIRVQGAFQDITERKRAELRLHQQATMLDNANDAITTTDHNWRITYWNKAAEHLYGYPAVEAVGQRLHDLLKVDSALIAEHELSLRENGSWKGEIQNTTRSGKLLLIQASWTLLRNQNEEPDSIFTIDTDVTEQREIENKFRQAQKMEAIGRLAGGVAHDFNNLLLVINGYSETMMDAGAFSPNVCEAAGFINKAGNKAANLTRQLLGFSRQAMLQEKVVDMNAIVTNATMVMRQLLASNIHLDIQLAPAIHQVKVDPVQIEQVLINLAMNSQDAMPHGGKLAVATALASVDDIEAGRATENSDSPYIVIAVEDNGEGMSEEELANIFEPFFTTKNFGKGAGLGLPMVLGFVQQSGGWVQVSSKQGAGSCFKIFLPAYIQASDAGTVTWRPLESPGA